MTSDQPASAGRLVPGLARLAWNEPAGGPRWLPPPKDLVVAALVIVTAVGGSYGEARPSRAASYFTPPEQLPATPLAALLLVAAAGAVLAWQRRYPQLVLGAATLLVVAYSVPGYVNGTAVLIPALALGMLAARTSVVRSVAWALAVTVVLMAATGPNNPLGWDGGVFPLIPADNAVALFAGIALASRRAYHASVRAAEAERAEQEAQRRVGEERLRIARELHDAVAHTMATITVQAAAAGQLLHDRPDEAAESLRAIRAAGKDGLRELRAIVDVLRSEDSADPAGPGEPTQPPAGMSRLETLTASVRAAGLPVTVTVTGEPRDLPGVTDQSAFRIIQEALTNTLRHAGPADATVAVDYGPQELLVTVTDTGRSALRVPAPSRPAGEGYGLRGMRERAAVAGGTVEAGPLPAGGFRVTARLPLEEGR